MSLWLIRVNETTQNERFRSMGKVSLLKFNGRSEQGRVWVHPTDDASSVGFCVWSQVESAMLTSLSNDPSTVHEKNESSLER